MENHSTGDVVEFLKHQHDLIKEKFDQVLDATGPAGRLKAFTDLRQMLAVHEKAEEMVIHPQARRAIGDGDDVVDARLAEERQAKEKLAELEKMDVGSPEFLAAVAGFRDAVLMHAVREEDEEFTRLRAEMRPDDLRQMANAVRAAEANDVFGVETE